MEVWWGIPPYFIPHTSYLIPFYLCGMEIFDKKIILASKSPRRSQLLEQAGFRFEVRTKEVEEDFPSEMPQPVNTSDAIVQALKIQPVEVHAGKRKLMVVLKNENEVLNCTPDFKLIKELPYEGVIVTSRGDAVDFVSRFFVPKMGIDEDPVTGSSHTLLTPWWGKQLNKTELSALQISPLTVISLG